MKYDDILMADLPDISELITDSSKEQNDLVEVYQDHCLTFETFWKRINRDPQATFEAPSYVDYSKLGQEFLAALTDKFGSCLQEVESQMLMADQEEALADKDKFNRTAKKRIREKVKPILDQLQKLIDKLNSIEKTEKNALGNAWSAITYYISGKRPAILSQTVITTLITSFTSVVVALIAAITVLNQGKDFSNLISQKDSAVIYSRTLVLDGMVREGEALKKGFQNELFKTDGPSADFLRSVCNFLDSQKDAAVEKSNLQHIAANIRSPKGGMDTNAFPSWVDFATEELKNYRNRRLMLGSADN